MPQRSFDTEAFEHLISRVRAEGLVQLSFPSAREALYFRHTFYAWRAQQRALSADPTELSDITIRRVGESTLAVTSNWVDPIIRRAINGSSHLQ